MEYKFDCASSGQRMSATEDLFGADSECPACGQPLVVPFPQESLEPRSMQFPQTSKAPPPPPPPPPKPSNLPPPSTAKPVEAAAKKKHSGALILLFVAIFLAAFYFCFGIFVIQPIGAIPDGTTVVYWRADLRMPFISSADGLLDESGAGVSLLGRGVFLAKISDTIKNRKIVNLPYTKTLYLWSTGGKEYDR